MSKAGYLAAAIFYACMLLVTAPASLLDALIQRITHERLSLSNCQGTIWHGRATPVLHMGKDSIMALQTLHWHIRVQALLLAKLKADLGWDNTDFVTPMEITLSYDSIILNNVLLQLPAKVIGELSPYLKPAQFSGNLTIESHQISYIDSRLQGNATAKWIQAGSAMSAVHPLGDYQIDISASQDKLRVTLSTQRGALMLGGQGGWSPSQKFHFIGTARATEHAALSELLHHLGPETAPGIFQISL